MVNIILHLKFKIISKQVLIYVNIMYLLPS
jgi:hypothetical protein